MLVYLVAFPSFLFGFYVSSRQSSFGAKTVLAWTGVLVALFFGIVVANLNLGPAEKFIAFATAGFSTGLAWRLVWHKRSGGSTGITTPSLAARERDQLERERNLKPDPPVKLPSSFDVDRLKETCKREQFLEFDPNRRLHWRTSGLRKDDTCISNWQIAARKLIAAVTDWNQMKSLLGICVFLGATITGTLWLNNVPVRWWLLIPAAAVFFFVIACGMHLYSNLNQPRPHDVVVEHKQFGRDHAADSYVEPWIPQSMVNPKYILSGIAVIVSYYCYLLFPVLRL